MRLKIKNKWQYKGNDRWDWQAFVDDQGSGELQNVKSVQYVLHPTFPNPIREMKTPENQFELRTNGWGVFELKAFVNMKDGKKIKLTHMLDLRYDPEDGISK